MNNKILTISIAAYNVEQYIKNTLDSITIPEILDDIEVLIVDDGGTDNSYNICKEFEEKYPQTFKVIHKENGGYGSVYNYNIGIASGKYFKLLDGDDYVDKEGFVKLVNTLKETSADVVFSSFNNCYENNKYKAINYDTKYIDKVTNIDDFIINNGIPMHAITYKTEVLRKSKMKLKEHVPYTDSMYITIPIAYVDNILVKDFVVYNYRLGLPNQTVNVDIRIKNFNIAENIYLELVDFYNDIGNGNGRRSEYLKDRIAASLVDHIAVALKMQTKKETLDYIIDFENRIKSMSKEIFDAMVSLDRKASRILKFLRLSNYKTYYIVSYLVKRIIK